MITPVTPTTPAGLSTSPEPHTIDIEDVDKRLEALQAAVDKAQELHDVALAALNETQLVAFVGATLADYPTAAYIKTTQWNEEPNDDGRFDVTLDEILDADGQEILDAHGKAAECPFGGVAAGNVDLCSTDWDFAMGDDTCPDSSCIKIAQVVAREHELQQAKETL